MPTWNSAQYLQFAEERTQPCRDLIARISVPDVRRVIDVGCGPGNSTGILAARWPAANVTGLDNSLDMLQTARQTYPTFQWLSANIADWAATNTDQFDVVFSSAALQWLPDHALLYPQLLARVAPAGALAIQIPARFDSPAHRLMREIAASPAWRSSIHSVVVEWHAHALPFYYDVLAPHAARIDLWETEYLHVMPSADSIVEFYRGTGLRPFLDALQTDADRARFTAAYLEAIRTAYPPQPNGRVLFPFRRLFLIAYRPSN